MAAAVILQKEIFGDLSIFLDSHCGNFIDCPRSGMTDQFIGNVELVERPERLLLCFRFASIPIPPARPMDAPYLPMRRFIRLNYSTISPWSQPQLCKINEKSAKSIPFADFSS